MASELPKQCRILIGQGCRSDWALSEPILRKLQTETYWCYEQGIY